MPATINPLLAFFRRLHADRGGNILMLTGGAILILALTIGFGIDYSRALRLQTKLNAAADAAVLAAVDPSMLSKDQSVAIAAAYAMFDYQVAGIPGLTVTWRLVTPSDVSASSLGTVRTFTISYTATSANTFAGILHMPTLPINGSATASASQPPSMNFYVAMDTSPSMLLPTTTDGITNLKAGALWSGEKPLYGQVDGCDFACHATNMQTWNKGTFVLDANKNAIYLNSAGTDFYRVTCTATGSGSSAIPAGSVFNSSGTLLGGSAQIRTSPDSSGQAAGSVSNTGCTTYTSSSAVPATNPVYIYYLPAGMSATTTTSTTTTGKNGKPVTTTTTTYNSTSIAVNFPDTYWLAQNYTKVNPGASDIVLRTDAEQAAAGGVVTYAYGVEQQYPKTTAPVYKMQFYTFNQAGSTAPVTSSTGGSSPFGTMTDVASLQGQTFPDTSALVPNIANPLVSNPYTSFTTMLTTMAGKLTTNGTGTTASPINVLMIITDGMVDDSTGISQFSAANVTACNNIKANKTRIAILYTQYIPDTINYTLHPTFNTAAKSYVPNIQAALQSCATQNADGTYLMQTVSTDGDVTAALNTLFAMVVQSARLVQ